MSWGGINIKKCLSLLTVSICSLIASQALVISDSRIKIKCAPIESGDSRQITSVVEVVERQERIKIIPAVQEDDFYIQEIDLPFELQKFTYEKSKEYGVDHKLVLALMWSESRFQSELISTTNDYGIMQINACHLKDLQRRYGIESMMDMLDPHLGIDYGTQMIARLVNEFGLEYGITAYKYGVGGMKKYQLSGTIPKRAQIVIDKYREMEDNYYGT